MHVGVLDWEDPLEQDMAIAPVFVPGEYHGQRSLTGYSPKGCTESDTTEATQYANTVSANPSNA